MPITYGIAKAIVPVKDLKDAKNIPSAIGHSIYWEDKNIDNLLSYGLEFFDDKIKRRILFSKWYNASQNSDLREFVRLNIWVAAQMLNPNSGESLFKEFFPAKPVTPLVLTETAVTSKDWKDFIESEEGLKFIPCVAMFLTRYGVSQVATMSVNLTSSIYRNLCTIYREPGKEQQPKLELNQNIISHISKYYATGCTYLKEMMYLSLGTYISTQEDELRGMLEYLMLRSFRFKGMYALEVFHSVCIEIGAKQSEVLVDLKHASAEPQFFNLANALEYLGDTEGRKAFPWSRAVSQTYHTELSNNNMSYSIGLFTAMRCELQGNWNAMSKFAVMKAPDIKSLALTGIRAVKFIRNKQDKDPATGAFYKSETAQAKISSATEAEIDKHILAGRARVQAGVAAAPTTLPGAMSTNNLPPVPPQSKVFSASVVPAAQTPTRSQSNLATTPSVSNSSLDALIPEI